MTPQEILRRARLIRKNYIEVQAATLDDGTALDFPEVFPSWHAGTDYITGERVRFEGQLYRCVQTHTSHSVWTPSDTPALWTPVAEPGEIPEWRQPTGEQDAYALGDKVHHNGATWQSDYNANVWEPGIYGWTQLS